MSSRYVGPRSVEYVLTLVARAFEDTQVGARDDYDVAVSPNLVYVKSSLKLPDADQVALVDEIASTVGLAATVTVERNQTVRGGVYRLAGMIDGLHWVIEAHIAEDSYVDELRARLDTQVGAA